MPLSKIQTDILRLLATHREPESYVAKAAALNRAATRYSGDIDIFHGREERVALAAGSDTQALETAGYAVRLNSPRTGNLHRRGFRAIWRDPS